MASRIQLFLLFEAATFAIAALVHFGIGIDGYEHTEAGTAEAVIAAALIAGLLASFAPPNLTRIAGLLAQGFALLGTLVGVFTIVVGVGPRTVGDVLYHVAIIAVLVWGMVAAWSMPATIRSG